MPLEKKVVLETRRLVRDLGEDEAKVRVLKGVNFSATSATTTAIVGPSGCGKSTLLYLLGLLDRPQEGDVILNGEKLAYATDPVRTAARNRLIGFVFQFHFLLPEFTALENVMLPMRKLGRLDEPAMRRRARELLDAVGLGSKADRPATKLSGGEQQRVAIGRALANPNRPSPARRRADGKP